MSRTSLIRKSTRRLGIRATRAVLTGLAAALAVSAPPAPASAQARAAASEPPAANYWVYVAAESSDVLHRVRFGPDGAIIEKTIPVGAYATETEGPHGLMISRDRKFLHMTTGHGLPDGMYWKIELGPDTVVGEPIPLGVFPATVDVTPDGLYAFVVNFNLHGEHVPSDVSVIYTPDVVEVARTVTCTMPHGSRLNPAGTKQYSGCMMDDQLVELDTRTFEVSRRFSVAKGAEGPIDANADIAGHAAGHGDMGHGAMAEPTCSPTWAQPSIDGSKVFVACNKADEILEIDAQEWKLTRRFATGRAPYNLAVTPDGRLLVATLKAGAGVQFFDLATGRAIATTPSTAKVTHGVVVSPDSRYAFVSVESIGADPGRLDVYDLQSFERVASADLALQAGGIAFWKMEDVK